MEIYRSHDVIERIHFPYEAIEKTGVDYTRGNRPAIDISIASKYRKIFGDLTTTNAIVHVVLKSNTETLFSGLIILPIKDGLIVLSAWAEDDVTTFFQKLRREPDYRKRFTPEELEASKEYLEPAKNPWYQKAINAELDQDYTKAEAYIKRAIESDSQQPSFYMMLGQFYYKQKKNKLALKEYLKAEELYQKTNKRRPVGLYLYMGDLYADLKEYERAIEYYNKLNEVYGYDPRTQLRLAGVHERMGEYDLALKEYQSLSKSDDKDIRKKALDGLKRIRGN
jgi:tetratricopeptide (TPR) repeat protein